MKRPNMKIPKSNFSALNQLFTETHPNKVSVVTQPVRHSDRAEPM
jgi:hypothetical protein